MAIERLTIRCRHRRIAILDADRDQTLLADRSKSNGRRAR
jgi:hypothetical protein